MLRVARLGSSFLSERAKAGRERASAILLNYDSPRRDAARRRANASCGRVSAIFPSPWRVARNRIARTSKTMSKKSARKSAPPPPPPPRESSDAIGAALLAPIAERSRGCLSQIRRNDFHPRSRIIRRLGKREIILPFLPRGDLLSASSSSFPSAMETIPIFYDAGSRLFYLHYRRRGPANGVIPRGKLRPYTTTRRETDTALTAVYDTPSYFSLYVTEFLVAPRCPSLLRRIYADLSFPSASIFIADFGRFRLLRRPSSVSARAFIRNRPSLLVALFGRRMPVTCVRRRICGSDCGQAARVASAPPDFRRCSRSG